MPTLRDDIVAAINRHSAENGSNTPDFILGDYLVSCLAAFDVAVTRRGQWNSGMREMPVKAELDAAHDQVLRANAERDRAHLGPDVAREAGTKFAVRPPALTDDKSRLDLIERFLGDEKVRSHLLAMFDDEIRELLRVANANAYFEVALMLKNELERRAKEKDADSLEPPFAHNGVTEWAELELAKTIARMKDDLIRKAISRKLGCDISDAEAVKHISRSATTPETWFYDNKPMIEIHGPSLQTIDRGTGPQMNVCIQYRFIP